MDPNSEHNPKAPATTSQETGQIRRWIALLPLLFYGLYVTQHGLLLGNPWKGLWICHLANLLLSVGICFRSTRLVSIAYLWLVMGNILWVVFLFDGGEFVLSSLGTHIGGLAVALFSLTRLGLQSGAWYQALLAGICLQWLTHWMTPPRLNINLAHSVWTGWENWFSSFFWYTVLIYSMVIAVNLFAQAITRRWLAFQFVQPK